MEFQSQPFVKRHGIVLAKEQCPYDAALTFNAGVLREEKGYRMLFRNDYGFCREDFTDFYNGVADNPVPRTNIGTAFSTDGVHWSVEPDRVLAFSDGDISRIYDPRLVKLEDGRIAMTFALDSRFGTRCGTAVTEASVVSALSDSVPAVSAPASGGTSAVSTMAVSAGEGTGDAFGAAVLCTDSVMVAVI